MSAASPTPSEIMRRLDEVVVRLDRLATTLEESFVRKDVLEAQNHATTIQIIGMEEEQRVIHKRIDRMQDNNSTNRRLIVASFVAPLVMAVVVALLLTSLGLR